MSSVASSVCLVLRRRAWLSRRGGGFAGRRRMNPDVVVIGAGCAGLSAAVRLAAADLRVVVVEEAPRLGGRATAFVDRETGQRVDNGQHVLFGCYRETYDFLRWIGSETCAPLQSRLGLTMVGADGECFEFAVPALPPPWHLIAGLVRWRALSLPDRLSALRLQPFLAEVRRRGPEAVAARVPSRQTVSEWLTQHRQSARLRQWLWHPLAVAALNQSPDVAAARPFVRVIAELFGPRIEDSAIGLPTVPLDELYASPAVRFVEQHSGRVLSRTRARILVNGDDGLRVQAGEETFRPQVVVSAVAWHGVARLWESAVPPALVDLIADAGRLESSPIVTVNLWLDGPVTSSKFAGLVDGRMQWLFDKSAIFGEHASHLSLVSSGADDIARMDNAEIVRLASDELRSAFPLFANRSVFRSVVVREHRATFSLAPGGPSRPQSSTPLPGFFLAGDWTDTGLPGTIESAVLSGHRAAN